MTVGEKLDLALASACLLSLPIIWRYWPRLMARIDGWLECPGDQGRYMEPSQVTGFTVLTFGDAEAILVPDDELLEVAGALAWIDSLPTLGDEVAA